MLDQVLAYYVPYGSFTFLELLYPIVLIHSLQGYELKAYKEPQPGEAESKYQPNIFLYYSLQAIMHVFAISTDQTFHVKEEINLKHKKANFYQNDQEMLDWIEERYTWKSIKLLQSYDITSFEKA